MPKDDTELSGKLAAFTSWIQTIGLLLFIISRLLFRETNWLLYLAGSLIIGAIICRLYLDWKGGRKKAFRTRLWTLIGVVVVGLVLVLIFGTTQNT